MRLCNWVFIFVISVLYSFPSHNLICRRERNGLFMYLQQEQLQQNSQYK
jgi:hypothetical protein